MQLSNPIQEATINCLVNLAKLFTPGVKLTLVARHISDDSAFMIFSEDNLEKVIETVQRHIKTKEDAKRFNDIIGSSSASH